MVTENDDVGYGICDRSCRSLYIILHNMHMPT